MLSSSTQPVPRATTPTARRSVRVMRTPSGHSSDTVARPTQGRASSARSAAPGCTSIIGGALATPAAASTCASGVSEAPCTATTRAAKKREWASGQATAASVTTAAATQSTTKRRRPIWRDTERRRSVTRGWGRGAASGGRRRVIVWVGAI